MSFVDALSVVRSSTRPVRNAMTAQPMSTGRCSRSPKADAAVKSDKQIATPPSSATGRPCHRSARGCATRPSRTATRRQRGTSASESANVTKNGAEMGIIGRAIGVYRNPGRTQSADESTFEQRVDRVDAVNPSDFLAFVGTSRVVADGNFEDAVAGPQEARSYLRFEVEADAPQPDAVERFATKHFVGRFHVREPRSE